MKVGVNLGAVAVSANYWLGLAYNGHGRKVGVDGRCRGNEGNMVWHWLGDGARAEAHDVCVHTVRKARSQSFKA